MAAVFGVLRLQQYLQEQKEAGAETADYPDYLEKLSVPEYEGSAWVEVNNGLTFFDTAAETAEPYEHYGELDKLGRCTFAEACLGPELLPEDPREEISSVIPTGWQNTKYDFIEDGFLYNRCHMIAFMLTGQNANEKNLVTGTRYMNVEGMLPNEIRVAEYIRESGNHVHYRVTPVFHGADLLASGILIEARSVEDHGTGLCFCVYCHNVQPGVVIDYATGKNHLE
ncbi:MAG: DNA/RNA non-specific endonuclease [Lachnospiraceae bacterium]|nr:DNA/RNA non-specific endonuclease [Lachnospiraceae bacterium]